MVRHEIKVRKNGIWFVEFLTAAGERKRVSLNEKGIITPELRAKAATIADEGFGPKLRPVGPVQPSTMTMRQLFAICQVSDEVWSPKACKSQKSITSRLKILNTYCGDDSIHDMTKARLTELKDEMFEGGTLKVLCHILFGTAHFWHTRLCQNKIQ